jgi:phosphoglycerol transferase
MINLIAKSKGRFFFCLTGFIFLGIAIYIKKHVGTATVDQMLSTYLFSIEGLFSIDYVLIWRFIVYSLLFPLLLSLIVLKLEHLLKAKSGLNAGNIQKSGNIAVLLLIGYGLYSVSQRLNIPATISYLLTHRQYSESPDYLAKVYQSPDKIKITAPSQPKSLILIYVESLETTYSNSSLFGHDLLEPLNRIKTPSTKFSKFEQVDGAEWTIAGLVASQCGIPLKLVGLLSRNRQFELTRKFLPNAVCLSDILEKHGYKNVFLNGGSLSFAGKGNFLKTHHYEEQYGKEQWLKLGFKKAQKHWGLPDDLLFEQAKIKVAQLIQENRPFNLTILTVNTHGIDGFINQTCYQRGARTFQDIVECTAYELSDFIEFVESNGWFKQVNILVMGDHIAMVNAVSDKLTTQKNHYVFNQFFGENLPEKNRESIVHFDILPSILSTLGFSFSPNQLALGKSGFVPLDALNKVANKKQWNEIIHSQSQIYNELWVKKPDSKSG